MNVLIATGIYPPESGGPAQYASGMALALTERGHHVSVIAYGEKTPSKDDAWNVARVSRSGGAVIRYIRFFLKALKTVRGQDVVFLQGAASEGFPMTLAAKLRGVPTVLRVPGDYAWEQYQNLHIGDELLDVFLEKKHSGKIGFFERMERWVAKRASRIIAPSRYLKTVVERWGAFPELTTVILNAEHSLPEGTRDEARRRFGVADKTVCLTVVRAVPWKGVAELISWWKELPDSHVLIVGGDGPEMESWKKMAEGLGDRVRFVGRLNRQELADWYRACDAFLLHSGYEGYPHVVAEAASLGVPCLVSDQGGNPETAEVFGDLISVLPYQNRNAWIERIRRVVQRIEVAKKAATWTHAQMVEHVETVLSETVEGKGPLQTVMFSFDRALADEGSDSSLRLMDLAGEGHAHAIVLSKLSQVVNRQSQNLSVKSFSGNSLRRIFSAILAGRRAVKQAPNRTVISAQDPFVAGFVGYIVSRWLNVPLEIQEHADFYSGYWVQESWKNRVMSWMGMYLLRHAERVRVVSERVREHVMKLGVPANHIEVIPVAQDVSLLLDRSIKSFASTARLVAPCRFVSQKGLETLLASAKLLADRKIDFRLTLIGEGPLLSFLHGRIEKLGLLRHVRIESWKKPDELWNDADIFVLSSNYEGWGRTVVEAMAAGVTVVATETGCVGSFFRPGVDGWGVKVGDAKALADSLEVAIRQPELAKQYKDSARERARSFPARSELHQRQREGWKRVVSEKRETSPRFDLWVFAFVLFALAVRLSSAFLFHHGLMNREWGFYTLVDHWFKGLGYTYADQLGCPSAARSPGYLFFLTGLYTIFSPTNTLAQALVQNLIAWLAMILVHFVGVRLVGKRAALLGAFIMTCYPYTFYHFTQYYHTFLSVFFLLFLVWTLLRLKENKKWSTAILAGISIAALAYIQGTILPVTPFIVAWLLWCWWPDWKLTLGVAVVMALVSIGLIAPWTYRNYLAFHAFVPLTTDLGHALGKANNEYIYEITKRGYPMEYVDDEVVSSTNPMYKIYNMPPDLKTLLVADGVYRDSIMWTEWHPREPVLPAPTCAELGPLNEKQFSDYWSERGFGWLKQNYWTEGWKVQLQKFKTFWMPGLFPSVKTGAPWSFANDPRKVFLALSAVWISTFVVVWIGWLGLIFVMIKRKNTNAVLVAIICLVYSLMHTLFVGYTKYRMPLDHLLAPFAAWMLLYLYETRIRRK